MGGLTLIFKVGLQIWRNKKNNTCSERGRVHRCYWFLESYIITGWNNPIDLYLSLLAVYHSMRHKASPFTFLNEFLSCILSKQNAYVVAEMQWKGLMFAYRRPGFESLLYHLSAVWYWTSHLISLSKTNFSSEKWHSINTFFTHSASMLAYENTVPIIKGCGVIRFCIIFASLSSLSLSLCASIPSLFLSFSFQ